MYILKFVWEPISCFGRMYHSFPHENITYFLTKLSYISHEIITHFL